MKTIYLLILLSFQVTTPLYDTHKQSAEKNIETIMGKGTLTGTEVFRSKEFYVFNSVNEYNGAIVVFSSAKGRYENFDYMLIVKDLNIINIKILKYRSDYGYEISNKGWLKQFYTASVTSFEYGKNIDSLSGATFSASSLVTDINLILDHLREKN